MFKLRNRHRDLKMKINPILSVIHGKSPNPFPSDTFILITMKSLKLLMVPVLFLMMTINAEAQQILVLRGPKGKIEKVFSNHRIGVRLVGEDDFFKGYLTSVGDSSFSVDGNVYYFREINAVRTYEPLFKTVGTAQRIAAGGVVGLNLVNNTLSGYRPLVSDEQWIWAGALFATSYVWDLFSRRTYEKEDGWRMETIDFARIEE